MHLIIFKNVYLKGVMMRPKLIEKLILFILTVSTLFSISYFNLYMSNYYSEKDPASTYSISPKVLFGLVLLLCAIQLIYVFKYYNKNK